MKKLLLSFTCLMMAVAAMAVPVKLTGNLNVMIGEGFGSQKANVSIDCKGNKVDFFLPNFCLIMDGESMPVGHIEIKDIPATTSTDKSGAAQVEFSFDGTITIAAGDQKGIDGWAGPELGEIPTKMTGTFFPDTNFLTCNLDIDMVGGVKVMYTSEQYATVYTDFLNVQVGEGEPTHQENIEIALNTDRKSLELRNFCMVDGEEVMGIGTIYVANMEVAEAGALTTYSYDGNITIRKGTDPSVEEWAGPELGELGVKIVAYQKGSKLSATITLEMLGGITVQFGEDLMEGITTTTTTTTAAGIYNLQGQAIAKALKGISIINNKKVLK